MTTVLRSRKAGWSIAFVDCDAVADGIESVLNGWGLVRASAARAPRADATITYASRRYQWVSARLPKPKLWDEAPPKTVMSVVSDVHDVLFDWYQLAHPERPCLHAGAVRIGPRLVCFPSVGKAGKSSLCVELAAAGHTFFCDDVLAIDAKTRKGIALGVAPMMRRPFPRNAGARLHRYAAERRGLSNKGWAYLRLEARQWAPLGAAAPIGAIVLLERGAATAARLERLSAADALREMVRQNFGCRGDRAHALATLHAVLGRADTFRLRYSNLREAADAIASACALPAP